MDRIHLLADVGASLCGDLTDRQLQTAPTYKVNESRNLSIEAAVMERQSRIAGLPRRKPCTPLRLVRILIVLSGKYSESFSILSLSNKYRATNQNGILLGEKGLGEGVGSTYSSYGPERPPIPTMPSEMFQRMAHSQLELLANSLTVSGDRTESKVESMALYLPQENSVTGQLEFTPVVLYPDPNSERVFIASDAASGQAPTLPRTLTKLPGFAHATTLLPAYPMLSSDHDNPGVGVVEEVMCDARHKNKAAALSVPLLSGSQTVGVLLVSPAANTSPYSPNVWTDLDRQQVSRAAQSLSMALSMDNERNFLKEQNSAFRQGLSDSLHQVKNPLQALRTYGKILQRQIANTNNMGPGTPQLLELTERLMVQSERVVDLMVPMDALVENMEQSTRLALQPAKVDDSSPKNLVVRAEPLQLLPWENETLEFARSNSTSAELAKSPKYSRFAETPRTLVPRSKRRNLLASPPKPRQPASSTVVGDLDLEMTFVCDVLEPILSAFRAIAAERGIRFEVVDEELELPGVLAAPKSLQEAISNILDNAFKYVVLGKKESPLLQNPYPYVRIRLLANKVDPGVIILVEDNGPGIADADRDNIFDRGFRGTSTSFVQGTGIGLDISKTLIERMGGTLEVADKREFKDMLDGAVLKCCLFRRPRI